MQAEIINSIKVLKQGGLLLYPTDTVWGIGCDATNYEAIEKIFDLKERDNTKSMICLVSDFKMLQQYVERIPEVTYDILKYAANPVTIIYDNPKHVAENIIAADNTVAIRVVRNKFCNDLIKQFGKPIVSTSANLANEKTASCYNEINPKIINDVDYVVNLDRSKKCRKTSTIIKLQSNGIVKILRK